MGDDDCVDILDVMGDAADDCDVESSEVKPVEDASDGGKETVLEAPADAVDDDTTVEASVPAVEIVVVVDSKLLVADDVDCVLDATDDNGDVAEDCEADVVTDASLDATAEAVVEDNAVGDVDVAAEV